MMAGRFSGVTHRCDGCQVSIIFNDDHDTHDNIVWYSQVPYSLPPAKNEKAGEAVFCLFVKAAAS